MCLRPVHFLLPVVPVVPGKRCLPLDRELETALFHRLDAKRCAVCGALFTPRAPTGPNTARNVRRKSTGRQKAELRAPKEGTAWTIRGHKNPL